MKKSDASKIFTGVAVVGAVVATIGAVLYARQRRSTMGGTMAGADLAGLNAIGATGFGYARGAVPKKRRGLSYAKMQANESVEHYAAIMPIQKRVLLAQKLVELSVKDSKMGPQMRKLALHITSHCPARDDVCEARAIYKYVKDNIRYTGDIAPFKHSDGRVEAVDLFQAAYKTLDFQGGDCDDHSILVAALGTFNGIPMQFRITAPKGSDEWGHIYPLFGLPKTNPTRWVAGDTTLPGGDHFGQEAPFSKFKDFVA